MGTINDVKTTASRVSTHPVNGLQKAASSSPQLTFDPKPSAMTKRAASNDNGASDRKYDQYYTRPDVAAFFYDRFKEYFDPSDYLMVEPSAGTGSFYKILPNGSIAYDIEPKYPGIINANFLEVEIETDRPIAIIGNPPFGKNSSTAVRFFNHAARQSSVIAFILPRTFRKASIVNRLDRSFHLVREWDVPADAFLFRSKPYDVPAVFQIWRRKPELRKPRPVETRHPDFKFTTKECADFAIQRVGGQAGRVHQDFSKSPSAHYFIEGNVKHAMEQIDFARVTGDVAGNPSLAKSEIVALYREWELKNSKINGSSRIITKQL